MSNTKKRSNKDERKRSALSFIDGNCSLDVDHVLQSNPWENAKRLQNSEAACIQNILNEFVDKISQEKKAIKAKDQIPAKKSSKSTKKSPMKSPIKDSTMDLPGTSSSTNGSVAEIKTTVNKKQKVLKKQNRLETSEKVEKTISQELPCNTDDVKEEIQKFSKDSAKKNVGSSKKIIKRESLQELTNIIEKNLQTSTPKKEIRKTTKTAKGEKSMAKKKKSKTKDSGNKSEKNVQPKRRQKKSENNTKNKQANTNLLGEEKKTEVKSENKLKCNKVNQNSSKNEVKACAILKEVKKECKVEEINNNIDKSPISKEYDKKKMLNQLKGTNSKKKKPENKLQKSGQTPKSKTENIKCQCEKSCIKCSDSHSLGKEHYKRNSHREKNLKAARALEDLSQRITDVKERMNSIKIDLEENDESLDSSNFNDPCSQLSNSSSLSHSSHTSSSFYSDDTVRRRICTCGIVDCSCSRSFSSDFSSFSGSSESTTESYSESESTSEGADSN